MTTGAVGLVVVVTKVLSREVGGMEGWRRLVTDAGNSSDAKRSANALDWPPRTLHPAHRPQRSELPDRPLAVDVVRHVEYGLTGGGIRAAPDHLVNLRPRRLQESRPPDT